MTLDVAHAEYAGGGPGFARVCLTGHARGETPCRLAPPTLLIADGPAWRRLAPVPGTPLLASGPDAPAFMVAYEVPLHLTTGEGAWWLEPGPVVLDGRVEELTARVAALRAEVAALQAREGHPAPDAALAATSASAAAVTKPAPARNAVAVPPPRTRLRGLRPTLPALLIATGALAVGDAVATVVWQEPVSALWASRQQHALSDDLRRLDEQYAAPSAGAAPPITAGATAATVAPTAQQRMRALARTLERQATGGHAIGELRIPRLDAHYVVVQGTSGDSLRRGPGHYSGTALPGQPGTVGIAGHRTTYGAPFRHLDALHRGDAITVAMPYGTFVYRVEGTRIVRPEDVSTLRSVGRPRLALTACHPLYSATKRLVVLARLERATPRGAAAAATPAGAAPAGAAGAVRAPRA
ncbi:MAG: sortase [Baekduia sp.]|nr:sortase [Baekduia sp.]